MKSSTTGPWVMRFLSMNLFGTPVSYWVADHHLVHRLILALVVPLLGNTLLLAHLVVHFQIIRLLYIGPAIVSVVFEGSMESVLVAGQQVLILASCYIGHIISCFFICLLFFQ